MLQKTSSSNEDTRGAVALPVNKQPRRETRSRRLTHVAHHVNHCCFNLKKASDSSCFRAGVTVGNTNRGERPEEFAPRGHTPKKYPYDKPSLC